MRPLIRGFKVGLKLYDDLRFLRVVKDLGSSNTSW